FGVAFLGLLAAAAPLAAQAPAPASPPAYGTPHGADFIIRDFHFASGEALPELRIHYTTFGAPHRDASGRMDNAVLILHGTGGAGTSLIRPQFAGELFGPGQLLDDSKYFIILPDGIGHGKSSKPSDGLRMRFPHYDYADMVEAQHRLVESLGITRLRLLMGTSMGCMQDFMWAEQWPDAMDAVMPMACLPVRIVGRNRLWRRMIIDAIEHDPAWQGGDYASEPKEGLRAAEDITIIAGSAPHQMQKALDTPDKVDKYLADSMNAALDGVLPDGGKTEADDANDLIYAIDASRDYDPSAHLEAINAYVMWVNSADDFINPPELGIAQAMAPRIKNGTFVLLPIGPNTHGHGTHTWAVAWKDKLAALLAESGPK
ncbi:MAG TPA: alpha/beta fold hydrolase, partial [Caulobacteraceae bacterium]|nr:alpha/beta fold hydrolase [Caulobacteraceae bacterium]